ncbi:MAG: choice-of-anchor Q domain-containing protein [Verrucomicrobiota bacterium]
MFYPPRVNSLQPLLGSPVIDAADPAAARTLLVDNFRLGRVLDGDLNGTALPDIGAVEAVAVKVTTAADELDTPAGANVSLREAIRDTTASSAIIRLDPALSGQTLTLDAAKGQITVGNNLLLDASALPAGFTIDAGSGANRIFQTSGTVRLAGLTLQGGEAGSDGGGAILMTLGNLILERCVVRDNTTTGSGGALNVTEGLSLTLNQCSFSGNSCTGGSSLGGAVNSSSSNIRFVITESSFTGNTANVSGGAIQLGTSRDPANFIRQCTVAGNRAAGSGGGIRISDAQATLQQCTITGNEGVNGSGGGLQGTGSTTVTMLNCVVAGNRAPTGPDVAGLDSTVTSRSGANVIGQNKDVTALFPAPAAPGAANANGDYVGTAAAPLDALLAPAGNYGGPALVQTCPPMPGSPALDRAAATSLTTDARGTGFSRVVDGDSDGTARADIGAAESVMVRVDVANDELDVPAGTNDLSLREAVRDAPEGAVISFASALSGQTLTLTAGELLPPRSVVITGSGLNALLSLTASSGSRILNLPSGRSAGLSRLRLKDCNVTFAGAAVLNEGMLSLADCEFIHNTAVAMGGAIRHTSGSPGGRLQVERCLFSGNASTFNYGGAISAFSALPRNAMALLLQDCRFTENVAQQGSGGAVDCSTGGGASMTLKVLRSTFTSNTAYRGGGLHATTSDAGSSGLVSVDSSTFFDNKAPGYSGGGLKVGAFGGSRLTTVVSQCTFAQNSSGPLSGGAVMNDGFDPGSSSLLTLRRCTLAGNSTTHAQGGGTSIDGYNSGSATTVLDGCIVAGNTSASTAMDVGRFNGAVVTSLGNNLIGNITGTSNVTWLGSDLTGTSAAPLNPLLASLGDYGGSTQTMPPLPGSPARNPTGGVSTVIVGMLRDQRGGVRLQGESMDIGSVEATAEDAPGTIAFGAPVVRVEEGTTALVPVYRTAGTIGTVTVSYASLAGTGIGFATSPADYTAVSGTLTFTPGETVKTISITAATDAPTLKEPHESFTLTLSNVTGGASPGAQSSTTVRILDSVDAAVPTLVLNTPKANAIFLESSGTGVSVTGSAKDDKGVQAVQVQLNGGAFVDAVLAPSTTSTTPTFALTVTAVPGVNTLVVRSVDEKGKISALQKRSFTYRVIRPLITSVSGGAAGVVGTITRPAAVDKTVPNSLYVGMTYKVTATPKPGYLFGGWSPSFPPPTPGIPRLTLADIGITAASLELPALSFIMQPGVTLTANFYPTVQPDSIGIYTGLILPSSTQPAPGGTAAKNDTTGLFTATIASTGAFSGTLKIDGASLPFAGTTNTAGGFGGARFGTARTHTLTLLRKSKPDLLLDLVAFSNEGETSAIVGTVTQKQNGTGNVLTVSTFTASRAKYSAKVKVPATLMTGASQRFNLILPSVPQDGLPAGKYPPGTGIGSMILGSDGTAKFAGILADSTPFTASAPLSPANQAPLFVALYTNKGHLAGTVNVLPSNNPGYDAYGVNYLWNRPAQPPPAKVQWYPDGWPNGIILDMVGAQYKVPAATLNQSVIPALGAVDLTNTVGNTTLTFMDGLLSSVRNYPVNITTKDAVTLLPLKTKDFTLTLTKATGEISGTFTHTDGKKPAFKGTTIQKAGDYQGTYGFFMSVPPNATSTTGQGGSVMLLPGAMIAP